MVRDPWGNTWQIGSHGGASQDCVAVAKARAGFAIRSVAGNTSIRGHLENMAEGLGFEPRRRVNV